MGEGFGLDLEVVGAEECRVHLQRDWHAGGGWGQARKQLGVDGGEYELWPEVAVDEEGLQLDDTPHPPAGAVCGRGGACGCLGVKAGSSCPGAPQSLLGALIMPLMGKERQEWQSRCWLPPAGVRSAGQTT